MVSLDLLPRKECLQKEVQLYKGDFRLLLVQ